MTSDKLIILTYSFFTSLGYSLMLYSIKNLGYGEIYYSYFLTVVYISILLASLFYGNVKIDEKNYLIYNFIGVISILISTFFLYYAEKVIYLFLSAIFMHFVGSSVSFVVVRFRKDIGMYYYFTLYGIFGYVLAQILLSLNLNFKIIVLFSFILNFLFIIFTFSFYFKKILRALFKYFLEDYGLFATAEKFLSYIERKENDNLFKFVGKPSLISVINFLIGFVYVTYWTSLVTISSIYNNLFPIFLFINNISLVLIYRILKKKIDPNISFFKSLYGIVLRFLGIVSLLYIFKTSYYNILSISLFYILAAVSWGIFSFYMDDYILRKREYEYGFVSFFRNLAAIFGSMIIGIIGLSNSLLFSIFIFLLTITLIFIFRKYI